MPSSVLLSIPAWMPLMRQKFSVARWLFPIVSKVSSMAAKGACSIGHNLCSKWTVQSRAPMAPTLPLRCKCSAAARLLLTQSSQPKSL